MKISLYSNTAEGWDFFASLGFVKEHHGKCVGCYQEMTKEELWDVAQKCFEKGFAVKMHRCFRLKPKPGDVDVVLMVDENKWRFRQR